MNEHLSGTDLDAVAASGVTLAPLVPAGRQCAVDGSTGRSVVETAVTDSQTRLVAEARRRLVLVVRPRTRRGAGHVASGATETQT